MSQEELPRSALQLGQCPCYSSCKVKSNVLSHAQKVWMKISNSSFSLQKEASKEVNTMSKLKLLSLSWKFIIYLNAS